MAISYERITPKLLIASQQLANDTRFTKVDSADFKLLVIGKDERVLKLAELLDDKARSPSAEFVERAKELLTAARAEGKVSGNADDAKRPGTARKRPGLTVGTDKNSLTPSQTPTSTPPPTDPNADPSASTTAAGASSIVPIAEPGSGTGTRVTRAGSGIGEEGKSARLLHRPQEISLKAVEVASSTDEAAEEDAQLRKRATRAAKRASLPAQLPTMVKDKMRPSTIEEGKEDLATPAPPAQ